MADHRVSQDGSPAVQALLDKQDIRDVLHLYSRGVDRGDWAMVARTYHPDAYDDHGPYRGDVPGLLEWLRERFCDVEDSSHFLGQSLVELDSQGGAAVETYFLSRRLVDAPSGEHTAHERMCREVWGRYLDRFELRDGRWAVARRLVVVDARYLTPVRDGRRRDDGVTTWGARNGTDPVQVAPPG